MVAEYRAKLPKFFKRYQVQPVWRADRPQKGRFREFYQCDVDAIGSTSMTVEAELLSAAADVFLALGFKDFKIVVNHRKLLNAVLAHAGVPAELHGAALVIVDKADKIGIDGVRKELADKGLAESVADTLLEQLASAPPADLAAWMGEQSTLLNDEGKSGSRRPAADLRAVPEHQCRPASRARSQPGARPVVLHRSDLRDSRRRPRRQPWRRRALRQPGRHVLGRRRSRRAGSRSVSNASSS